MFAAMMILVLLLCGVGLGDSFAMVSSTVQRGTGASNIFKLHPSDRKALDDSFGALFKNVGGEKFGEVHASTGQIPKDIQGTYFRNGSGKWQVAPGEEYQSPFDGDGHILAVSFSEGRAFTRNKLVRTQGFMEELRENKVCYRGFGVKPGGWLANAFDLRAKNVANTSIVFWAGKLLALWEAGAPHELDPLTLETIGLSDINGQLQGAEKEFSAHPRVDRKRNRLVGFGSSIRENKLRIYEFGPTFDLVEPVREEDLGQGFHMLHDFGLTDRYCIFLDSPLDFDYVRFMLGLSSTGSSISAAPASSKRTTRILLVPRGDPNAPVIEIKSDSKDYAFHFANAFDDPVTGEVVFDVCQCKDKLFFGDMKGNLLWENPDWAAWPETYLTRYRIDPVGKRIVERKENGVKGLINTEFPSVADSVSSAPHRFVFTLNSPYQAVPYGVQKVGKIDTLTRLGDFFFDEETKWYSEPQFIPREGQQGGKGEDFGYLLSTVSDGATHKSEVVIFDAQNVSQGPICRIPVEPFLPHSLHGAFYPDAVFHIDLLQKSFQEVR